MRVGGTRGVGIAALRDHWCLWSRPPAGCCGEAGRGVPACRYTMGATRPRRVRWPALSGGKRRRRSPPVSCPAESQHNRVFGGGPVFISEPIYRHHIHVAAQQLLKPVFEHGKVDQRCRPAEIDHEIAVAALAVVAAGNRPEQRDPLNPMVPRHPDDIRSAVAEYPVPNAHTESLRARQMPPFPVQGGSRQACRRPCPPGSQGRVSPACACGSQRARRERALIPARRVRAGASLAIGGRGCGNDRPLGQPAPGCPGRRWDVGRDHQMGACGQPTLPGCAAGLGASPPGGGSAVAAP